VRVNTIEIPVASARSSAEWYARCLGLAAAWSDHHHALLEGASNDAGDGPRILLVETDDETRLAFTSSRTGVAHSVLDFITDDLDALHEHLKASGASVEDLGPPPNAWAPRGFAFLDPDGNRLAAFTYARR